jgi:hypothetical protein
MGHKPKLPDIPDWGFLPFFLLFHKTPTAPRHNIVAIPRFPEIRQSSCTGLDRIQGHLVII